MKHEKQRRARSLCANIKVSSGYISKGKKNQSIKHYIQCYSVCGTSENSEYEYIETGTYKY